MGGGRTDFLYQMLGSSFEARYWMSLDPCGLFCVCFSLGVHIYATIISGFFIVGRSNEFLATKILYNIVYLPLTFMAVWSLYMAWSTDPGAVPMGARPLTKVREARSSSTLKDNDDEDDDNEQQPLQQQPLQQQQRAIRRCHKCNDNFKPARAHHDSVTGRCIVKFDHFCPWVGNAVGAFNHKFFCLFVGYTLCACLVTLVIILLHYLECRTTTATTTTTTNNSKNDETIRLLLLGLSETEEEESSLSSSSCDATLGHPLVIALLIVAFFFFIFTSIMLCDQIEAIRSNTSKIARMKLKVGQGGTELERVSHEFNEMFGGTSPRIAWHWFVPLPITFPNGMETVVRGYDYDPITFGNEPYTEENNNNNTQQTEVLSRAMETTTTVEDDTDEENQMLSSENDTNNIELETIKLIKTGTKKRVSTIKNTQDAVSFVEQTKNRLI